MDTAAAYPSTYLLLQLAPLTSRIKEETGNIFEGNHFFHQIGHRKRTLLHPDQHLRR